MRKFKLMFTTLSILFLVALLGACQPIQPITEEAAAAAEEGERLFFSFVVSSLPDTNEGYRLVMEGKGTFDPMNPGPADGGGVYWEMDASVEGTPKPFVGLGVGTWQAKEMISYTHNGDFAAGTSGIVDLAVELTSTDGDVHEAILRVNCNLGAGGLFSKSEDGETIPEGIFLMVEETTYEPIVAEENGLTRGLTLLGPVQ